MQNILLYLRYLPFLVQVVTFVRQAEATYKGPGKGVEKLAWATDQFQALVNGAEQAKLINAKLAQSLRDGATVIITVVVEVMNAAGGVPPAPAPVTP